MPHRSDPAQEVILREEAESVRDMEKSPRRAPNQSQLQRTPKTLTDPTRREDR